MNESLPPAHKLDIEELARLKRLSEEERMPLLPELLQHIQAGDDPAVRELAELLTAHGCDLIPHLKIIMESGDSAWKYAVMERLVRKLPDDVVLELAPEMIRLAMNPSDADQSWEIDELAEEMLNRIV